jgi:hypothetical protein
MESINNRPSEKAALASLQAENASLRAELKALRENRTQQTQTQSQSQSSHPDSSSVDTCHFFRLPREIRDAIYELCVVPGIIFIKRPDPFPHLHGFDMRDDSQRPQTKAQCQLFLVNTKLRSEALEVFVSMNQFVLSACTHPIEPPIPGHREGSTLLERHLRSISVSFNSIETAPFVITRKYPDMAATARDYDGTPDDGDTEFHDSPETSAHYRDITMQLMIRFSITLAQLFEFTGQLRRIQINLEATVCPLGCHRIVRPVFYACQDRLARLFAARPNDTLESIDFLGTVSDEERETIRMAFPDPVREKITFHGAYNRRWAVWDSMSVVHTDTEEMNVEAEAADLEADLLDLLVHM